MFEYVILGDKPKPTKTVYFYLEQAEDGIELRCADSISDRAREQDYVLLTIKKEGYLELVGSQAEDFGFKLDSNGCIVAKNEDGWMVGDEGNDCPVTDVNQMLQEYVGEIMERARKGK